jgi:hypothetical protein
MPNQDATDHAEMTMMTALRQFKKKHGDPAYLALLSKFNVDRWSQIPATAHGKVTMQCAAGITDLTINDAEDGEDDTPSIQSRLNEMAATIYGTPKDNSDFATVVNSAPTIQEGFNLAARAIHARAVK